MLQPVLCKPRIPGHSPSGGVGRVGLVIHQSKITGGERLNAESMQSLGNIQNIKCGKTPCPLARDEKRLASEAALAGGKQEGLGW